MSEDEKKILYVPELSPERHYDTVGAFENYVPDNVSKPDTRRDKKNNKPAEIYNALKVLEDAFNNIVPDDVKFVSGSIIRKLRERLDIIVPDKKRIYSEEKDKETYVPEEIKTIDTTRIDTEPASSEISLFPTPININLTLEDQSTLVEIIQSDYEKDQLNLDDYYQAKLQLVLQDYIQNMLSIMSETGVADMDNLTMEFDGDTVSVPSGQGLEHCRDFIVRSQIARNQKSSLFKKTHSTDNTVSHLRAWQAAEKQRERYYSEEYGDSGTYVESHSNALLRSQRAQYDSRYKAATYSMYKYLTSSAQLIADSLSMIVKEAQAKAHLLNNGVNIYATSDTENPYASTSDSSSSTSLAEDTVSSTDSTVSTAQDAVTPGDKEDENHSHGKAPNGKYYANSDWDNLKSNGGLTDEQVKTVLDLDSKYSKTEETDSNNNSDSNGEENKTS